MLRALFTQDKRYRIGKLKPFIYLYSVKDTVINFNKNECYQINSTDSYILHCASANYTSSSSDNGMYQFKSSVEVVLDEHETLSNYDVLEQLLSNEWYVGIETQEGDRFLMSPEFAAEVTYTYTANDTEKTNNTNVTFTVNTNVPNTVVLSGFSYKNEMVAKECRYKIGTVTELRLAKADDTTVQFSGNSFALVGNVEKIEYNKQTLVFQEQYDGVAYTQTLSFEVPFEAYQHDFHYELLEFVKNEYYALMTTMTGRHILGGFELGMLPSYTITSSEDNSPNPVQITLEYKTSSRGLVAADNVEYEENDKPIYQIVDWNCVDEVYAATLIKQTTNGLTNGYRCLAGYESQYANYNIIGTYDSIYTSEFGVKLTNTNVKCEVDKQCTISGLPSTVTFTEVMESKIFTIQSPCDPIFFETDKYTLRYERGLLTVINLAEEDYTILIMDGDGGSYLINVTVTIPVDIDTEYSITAEAQRLKVDVIFGLDSIDSYTPPTNISLVPTEDNNGWYANIPENEDTLNQVQYVIHIEYDNGYSENITINQDKLYERFEDEGIRQCGTDGGLYKYLTRYIGYYPDDINIRKGYTQSVLVEENSTLCRKEEDTEGGIQGSICVDGVIYNIVEYDGVKNAEATNEFCDKTSIYFEDWRLHESDYECVSGTAYGVEVRWISNDNVNFYPTNETRVSSVEVEGDCVVITPISSIIPTPSALTFESSGGTLTLSLEYNNPVQGSLPTAVPSETWCTVASGNENFNTFFATTEYSVTVDTNPTSEERTCKLGFSYRNGLGGTATCMVEVTQKASVTQYRTIELPRDVNYICDGFNKYAEIAEQKSNDGVFWETISTSKGDLIEENSTDCGYIPIQYRDLEYNYMEEWECVGYDKHYKVAHQESTDGGKTWNTISTSVGDLVEGNSADCSICSSGTTTEHYVDMVFGSSPAIQGYNEASRAYVDGVEVDLDEVNLEDIIQDGTRLTLYYDKDTIQYTYFNPRKLTIPGGWSVSVGLYRTKSQLIELEIGDVELIGVSGTTVENGIEKLTCSQSFLDFHSPLMGSSKQTTFPKLKEVTLTECTTSIPSATFMNCTKLSSITIPDSVTSIGSSAFNNCDGLTSIDIPDSVISIGQAAFSGCTYLTSVNLPHNLETIENTTFSYCTRLSSITIPVTVTSIGQSAFNNCGLTNIIIPDSVTSIGSSAFESCDYLLSVEIPSSVKTLEDATFKYCSGLWKIELNEGLETVGNSAFYGCSGITSDVIIPHSVTTISDYAFAECERIPSIEIGSGVTTIGCLAFQNCYALDTITCYARTAPKLTLDKYGKSPFVRTNDPSSGVLYYPIGSDYSSWLSALGSGWTGIEMDI